MKPFHTAIPALGAILAIMLPLAAQAQGDADIIDSALMECETAMTEAAKAPDFTLAKGPCEAALARIEGLSGGSPGAGTAYADFAVMKLNLMLVSISIKINDRDIPQETCPMLREAVAHGEAIDVESLPEAVQMEAQYWIASAGPSEENCPDT